MDDMLKSKDVLNAISKIIIHSIDDKIPISENDLSKSTPEITNKIKNNMNNDSSIKLNSDKIKEIKSKIFDLHVVLDNDTINKIFTLLSSVNDEILENISVNSALMYLITKQINDAVINKFNIINEFNIMKQFIEKNKNNKNINMDNFVYIFDYRNKLRQIILMYIFPIVNYMCVTNDVKNVEDKVKTLKIMALQNGFDISNDNPIKNQIRDIIGFGKADIAFKSVGKMSKISNIFKSNAVKKIPAKSAEKTSSYNIQKKTKNSLTSKEFVDTNDPEEKNAHDMIFETPLAKLGIVVGNKLLNSQNEKQQNEKQQLAETNNAASVINFNNQKNTTTGTTKEEEKENKKQNKNGLTNSIGNKLAYFGRGKTKSLYDLYSVFENPQNMEFTYTMHLIQILDSFVGNIKTKELLENTKKARVNI